MFLSWMASYKIWRNSKFIIQNSVLYFLNSLWFLHPISENWSNSLKKWFYNNRLIRQFVTYADNFFLNIVTFGCDLKNYKKRFRFLWWSFFFMKLKMPTTKFLKYYQFSRYRLYPSCIWVIFQLIEIMLQYCYRPT